MTIRRIFYTYRRVFAPIAGQPRQSRLRLKYDPNPRRDIPFRESASVTVPTIRRRPSHVRYQPPATVGLCA